MAGGVAMATPEGEDMGTPAQDGDHFILSDKPEEKWLEWAPKIKLNQPVSVAGNNCADPAQSPPLKNIEAR